MNDRRQRKTTPATTQPPPSPGFQAWLLRRYALAMLLAACLALALRLAVGAQLADTSTVCNPLEVTDMATYRTLALAIRQGNWPQVFDYQPFYYTIFLPFAYLFSPNGGPWPVIVLQALVGTATVLLAGAAAARLFGRAAGLLAALLLALARFHIFYTPYLLLEVWFAFWCALVLYCTLRAMADRRHGWLWHALLGLALAGALLTRGNALLWLPGLLAILAWHQRRSWRRLALNLALLLLCFALPIVPYSIHNSRATGKFQGASVAGGKVLALGNTPEAPAGGLEYPRTYHQWCRDADRGRMSVPAHILKWFREQPLAFLELKFRAALLFWDAREIPNNISFEVQGRESSLLQSPILLPWSILGTLGLAGLLLACRNFRHHRLALIWMMLAYWGATSAFYLLARFRVGFLPLLCVAGAGAATTLLRQWHTTRAAAPSVMRTQRLAVAVFVVLFAFYTVNFAHPLYQGFAEPAVQRQLRPNGMNLRFPREFVLYDHGPLVTADTFIDVPPGGLQLTKRFRLPDNFHEELVDNGVDHVAHQRLSLRIFTRQRGMPAATLTYNGTRLPVAPTIQFTQGVMWLTFDFDAPLPAEGALAIFTIDLAPSPAVRNFSFGLDSLRNYGRTSIHAPGFEEETANSEAVVDWIIPRRRF